jgi:neutral ceramidase
MQNLQAGTGSVDITPPLGTLVNGDFITHYATAIHQPLFAKALVLANAGKRIAICVVDICAMRRSLIDDIKLLVEKYTGIAKEQVLISSTHTHAAGSVESLLLGAADLAYRLSIPEKIAAAIVQANRNLQPAKVGFNSIDIPEYVLCRRYQMKDGYQALNPLTGKPDQLKTNPFGAEDLIIEPTSIPDPGFAYLAIKTVDNRWLCLLANYSLHYVGDWPAGTISPDYFGAFSKQITEKLKASKDFLAILSNGTSGEVNIWDFLHPDRFPTAHHAKSELIATAIAEKVMQSIDDIEWETDPLVSARYKDLTSGVRKPSDKDLEKAKMLVSNSSYEQLEGIDYETMRKLYARETVLLNEFPDEIKFPVQLFQIGNIRIGALGGEFFAETGLSLKSLPQGKKYFTITLANDYVGYVCPEHELEKGGYETWTCRTSYLNPAAEGKIRACLAEMIQEAADMSTLSNLR